jgi:MFS family permease
VGLPGVLLAFLAFAIGVNDRDRAKTVKAGGAAAGAWTFAGYVREHRFFLATYVLSTSLTTICAYTIISWAAAYFGRAFAWDHARIGLVVGLGMGCGGIGNVMWGYLADWLTRRGYPDGIYRVFIPLMILGPPVAAVAFLVRDPVICLPAFALMSVVFSGFGPIMAALQVAAPDYLRGRLTAAKMVLASIVGLGAGPVAAGFLVDVVFQDRNRLGEAMTLTITVASLAAAALLVWGRKAYVRAVEQVAQTSSAVAPADAPLPAGAPATGTA